MAVFLLLQQLFVIVIMASQGESSFEISEFTSSGEIEDTTAGASGTVMDETPRSGSGNGVPVPDALAHLFNHGVKFKSVSHWSKTARPMLVKSLSVYFSVDTVVTSQVVLEAFDSAGVDVDFITSIQWRASNRASTWVVAFENQEAKEAALEVASLEIAGTTVFLCDCENQLVLVKIYEAPAELPDTVVIGL